MRLVVRMAFLFCDKLYISVRIFGLASFHNLAVTGKVVKRTTNRSRSPGLFVKLHMFVTF